MSQKSLDIIVHSTDKPKGIILSQHSLTNLICIMAFFPFISLVPGMQAEVQPYCYLVAFLFIILFRQKLPYFFYLFVFIVVAYFLLYLVTTFHSSYEIAFQSIPHLLIFVGPPLFLWVIYKHFQKINLRILHNIFYIWVAVGFLQHLFPSIFAAIGLKGLLENLIPRFSVESLAGWGDRGVTSLSSEPSYAGIVFFSLFTVVIYRYLKGEITNRMFLFNLLLYLVSLVYNASVTMFLLTLLLLLSYIYHTRKYLLSVLVIILAIIPFILFEFQFRIIDLFIFLPDMLEANDWNPYYVMIGPLGSHREFSTYVALKSGLINVFGNGYYSSLDHFIDVAKSLKVDLTRAFFFDYTYNGYYVNMKPYGYGALVLFEIGLIPFLLINGIMIKLIKTARLVSGPFKRFGNFLVVGTLLLINLNTPASLPSYWFAFVVALMIISVDKKNKEEVANG